jgi:hypothetical protein
VREQNGKKEGAGAVARGKGDEVVAFLSTGFPQMGQAGLGISDRYITRS